MYSIGRFSKICNVPIKTLRYYDDIGLLKPSYIDSETNYRYYDYDKIDTIKLILLLKSLHVPLADIKQIIESAVQYSGIALSNKKFLNWKSKKNKSIKT